jgi:hypothetical protein
MQPIRAIKLDTPVCDTYRDQRSTDRMFRIELLLKGKVKCRNRDAISATLLLG